MELLIGGNLGFLVDGMYGGGQPHPYLLLLLQKATLLLLNVCLHLGPILL